MKNIVIVDVDTDRDDMVVIGKPADIPEPETVEEIKVMVDLDIKTLTEALITLVTASHINEFVDKDALITGIHNRIKEGVDKYTTTEETETTE